MNSLVLPLIIIHIFMDCNRKSHIFMHKSETIFDRLHILMDGREKYPWGQSIGLGKGTIDGMTRTGSIPGGDTLAAIRRCENARIDWILDGRGAPYSVSCVTNDEAGAELLDELMVEPDWRITIVTDGLRIALVLDQPGAFEVKDGKDADGQQRYKFIAYSILEVLAGNVGRLTMDLVRGWKSVSLALVAADDLSKIERGRVGTWRLLLAPDAMLREAQPIDAKHRIFTGFNQQELFPASPDEAVLLDHYRAMTPENRSAVNQVVTAMEKHGTDAGLKNKASS